MRLAKVSGGLGIKDPLLFSLSLRAKLIWRLLIPEEEWWKEDFIKKYIPLLNPLSPEEANWTGKGSIFWRLCKVAWHLILNSLQWKDGNEEDINIWSDPFSPNMMQDIQTHLSDLKGWLDQKNRETLANISLWDPQTREWMGWSLYNLSENL